MNLDHQIFQLINQTLANSWFDSFFPVFTDLHKTIWFPYLLGVILLISFFRKWGRWAFYHLFVLILTVGISDWIGAQVKDTFRRPRPFQNQELNAQQRSFASENSSFYSNHSSNNFAAAYQLTYFFPVAKYLFFVLAFLVGYSRIYNGVHYPSDVVCGALAGLFIAYLILRLSLVLKRKIQGSEL